MPRKVEATGCATPLRDVPDADAVGFATLLEDAVLRASCEESFVQELDADGSLENFSFPLELFGGEAVLAILGAEA